MKPIQPTLYFGLLATNGRCRLCRGYVDWIDSLAVVSARATAKRRETPKGELRHCARARARFLPLPSILQSGCSVSHRLTSSRQSLLFSRDQTAAVTERERKEYVHCESKRLSRECVVDERLLIFGEASDSVTLSERATVYGTRVVLYSGNHLISLALYTTGSSERKVGR